MQTPIRPQRPRTPYSRPRYPNAYRAYGLLALAVGVVFAAILFYVIHDLFWSYLIAVNLTAFLLYGWDKYAAQSGLLRVPERVLLVPIWILGWPGSELGRRIFHHKTLKVSYRIKYWLSAALTAAAVVAYLIVAYA